MNELRRKIIYYYILFTVVLLTIEWYLFQAVYVYIPKRIVLTETKELLLELAAIIISIVLFSIFSYGYFRKINQDIEKEAKRQVKERNELFANIAHDLKNPISSVLGFSRALESGTVKVEEQQAILHTICEKSLQIDEMIRKMFDYAKLEAEGYKLQCKNTDLCGVLREVLALQYCNIEEKDIQLEIQLPEQSVWREIDVTEFSRVLHNLVSNAIRHNKEGIKLLVSLKQEKKGIKIIVADSGEEIPPEQRETIFEPFQCSDESRVAKNGSGLGLAIAKQIMRLHNGRIYIDDTIEGYTKGFVIELVH